MNQQKANRAHIWNDFRTAFEKSLHKANTQRIESLKITGDKKYFFSETIDLRR
jgi:hypothetical protein